MLLAVLKRTKKNGCEKSQKKEQEQREIFHPRKKENTVEKNFLKRTKKTQEKKSRIFRVFSKGCKRSANQGGEEGGNQGGGRERERKDMKDEDRFRCIWNQSVTVFLFVFFLLLLCSFFLVVLESSLFKNGSLNGPQLTNMKRRKMTTV